MNPTISLPDSAPRRYLATFGLLAGGLALLTAIVNYVVDPDAYFGRNSLGFFTSAERQFKILGLQRHAGDAVLLGNSKAALADTSLVHGPYPFFNAGVGGSLAEDVTEMTDHVPPGAPLVVLALEYGQFGNSRPYGGHLPPPVTGHDWLANLLSGQILVDSLKTITSAARRQPPAYLPDGNFVTTGWYAHYDLNDPAGHAQVVAIREAQIRDFALMPERMAMLPKLKAALVAHPHYLVYIIPVEAEEMASLRRLGLRPVYDAWRARVREVFPDVVDLTDTPYANPKNFFHLDIMHPYPNIGAQMIQQEVLPQLRK